MHFEILVEDQSGKKALDILVPQIIGDGHTFNVHSYKGIGRIPKDLHNSSEPNKRILLDQLPRLLNGYGRTFANYPAECPAVVIVVCDLDNKCLKAFRTELFEVLNNCSPRPETCFCIAIEESEAWFLGDIPAIRMAYPNAKEDILNDYKNDTICGTWEKLADAVYPGGARKLLEQGWHAVGKEKSEWSQKIVPHMNVDNNHSPSFRYFYTKIRNLVDMFTQ